MKKLLITCALGALGLSVYAQGLVTIQTTSFTFTTNATASSGGTSGRMGSTANSYYFELLYMADPSQTATLPSGPTGDANNAYAGLSAWTDTGVSGTNYTGINAGHLNAITGIPGAAAAGMAAGTTNFILVVGWSANEGSSWATVSAEALNGSWTTNGYNTAFGISSVGYLAAGQAPAPFPAVFSGNPGGVGAFAREGGRK